MYNNLVMILAICIASAVFIYLVLYFLLSKNNPLQMRKNQTNLQSIIFCLLTILITQQIINILFPTSYYNQSTMIFVKSIIDFLLVMGGFFIPIRVVGWAITIAGAIRLMFILFQLGAVDVSVGIVIILLFVASLLSIAIYMYKENK